MTTMSKKLPTNTVDLDHLGPDLLAALDAFIADELDSPSRPEAIRRLVADHPAMQQYLSER